MRRNYIRVADAFAFTKTLPDQSIHCIATSPPYWGQRDYGVVGQLGLEADIKAYLGNLVTLFADCWRILRDDGVLFVNLGDRYAAFKDGKYAAQTMDNGAYGDDGEIASPARSREAYANTKLKNKDLVGLPWRFAFAMQEAGWWLRTDICWHKPNGMPESVTDRFTRDHEYCFMFTKSGNPTFWTHRDHAGTRRAPAPDYRYIDMQSGEEVVDAPPDWKTAKFGATDKKRWRRINLWQAHDYYFDRYAVAKPAAQVSIDRQLRGRSDRHKHIEGAPGQTAHSLSAPRPNQRKNADEVEVNTGSFKRTVWEDDDEVELPNAFSALLDNLDAYCHLRGLLDYDEADSTVWEIATEKLPFKHYAAFPTALVRPMILAGTPPKCCAACGAPYTRVGKKTFQPQIDVSLERGLINASGTDKPTYDGKFDQMPRGTVGFETEHWLPTCDCNRREWEPAVVFDPFMGSGTTALVAKLENRDYVGCDLNPNYVEIARQRVFEPMFDDWSEDADAAHGD